MSMTYFNNLVLSETHIDHYNFPDLYISESHVKEVVEKLKSQIHKVVRQSFFVSCGKIEGCEDNILDLDSINVTFDYEAIESETTKATKWIRKLFKKERRYTKLRFDISYTVVVKENFNRNYLKLKDYDLYNRIYGKNGKELNSMMYINFYNLFEEALYYWNEDEKVNQLYSNI